MGSTSPLAPKNAKISRYQRQNTAQAARVIRQHRIREPVKKALALFVSPAPRALPKRTLPPVAHRKAMTTMMT